MATYRARGDRVDYTPGSDVTAGDVVAQGTLVGVATSDIESGDKGSLAIEGIFDFTKEEVAFTAGDDVYWDTNSEMAFKGETGSGKYLGKATQDAAAGDSTVRVKLVIQEAGESGTATGTGTGVA